MTKKSAALATTDQPGALAFDESNAAQVLERVIASGDLSRLSAEDRNQLYVQTCSSLGLNPLTRPFEYVSLQGKMVLYARKDATDQLRALRGVSINIVSRERVDGLLIVTARAFIGERADEATGVVAIENARGESLANAYMKAETKAKRRVTLSICGLGFLDESEVESVQSAPAQVRRVPLLAAQTQPADVPDAEPSAPSVDRVAELETLVNSSRSLDELAEHWRAVNKAHKARKFAPEELERLGAARDSVKAAFAEPVETL